MDLKELVCLYFEDVFCFESVSPVDIFFLSFAPSSHFCLIFSATFAPFFHHA